MPLVDIHQERLHEGGERIGDMAVVGHIVETDEDVVDKLHDVGLHQRQRQFVVLDPPELQQLVDQSQHAVSTLLHIAQRLFQGTGHRLLGLADFLHSPLNQRQRRTEFMGDVCEEAQFVLCQLPFHGKSLVQAFDSPQLVIDQIADQEASQQVEQFGPPRGPLGGVDGNGEHLFVIAPSAFIAVSYVQRVGAGLQVLIGSGIHVPQSAPLLVIAFKHIGVACHVAAAKVEIREVDGQGILVMVQGNRLITAEIPFDGRVLTHVIDRHTIDKQVGDHILLMRHPFHVDILVYQDNAVE